ncbi:MAG: hypothetical protein IJN60_04725 [Oscillospiraceae bacterium]|nr:hypothetical protein [Oscillospiraceae bacterium]
MKNFTRITALLLVLIVALGVLAACGQEKLSGSAAYSVKVTDAKGTAYTSGVIVKFMKDGNQVAMQPVDANGVATKELERGDYTVELVFTDDNSGYFDPAAAVMSAEKTSIELKLSNRLSEETTALFADGKEYAAYSVTVGSTYVPVKGGDRNYFLFVPTEEGTYQFTVDNSALAIGYYGAPHFVQALSAVDVVDNVFSLSISKSSLGGAVYVIGVDGTDADTNCLLSIERTGAPAHNVADEPWTEYKTSSVLNPYTLEMPAGKDLVYMDITAETAGHEFFFNEADGYYHLDGADGPVIHVHLAKGAPYVALQTVIQGDGAMGGAPIRHYFYDESGNFVKKEDYTNILVDYFENMDEEWGVYPLTDDLVYIIQNGCQSWWDKDSPDYIFEDCNPDLGWMFACCWVG